MLACCLPGAPGPSPTWAASEPHPQPPGAASDLSSPSPAAFPLMALSLSLPTPQVSSSVGPHLEVGDLPLLWRLLASSRSGGDIGGSAGLVLTLVLSPRGGEVGEVLAVTGAALGLGYR